MRSKEGKMLGAGEGRKGTGGARGKEERGVNGRTIVWLVDRMALVESFEKGDRERIISLGIS